MSARREEPCAGAVKGLRRGWAEGLQGPRAVLPPGERPLKSRGGKRADKKGPQEPGRGAGCLDSFGRGLPGSLLVLCQAPASSA